MIIFKNKLYMTEYPSFRHQKGGLCAHLIGVNIGTDPKDGDAFIEPIYLPAIEWSSEKNVAFVSLNLSKLRVVIALYRFFPFITIFKNATLELEDDARD
jgi:hypothetical protein